MSVMINSYGILVGYSVAMVIKVILWLYDRRNNNRVIEETKKLIGDKVWSIPIERVCPSCKSSLSFDFDLETTEIVCPRCQNKSKLTLDVLLFHKN